MYFWFSSSHRSQSCKYNVDRCKFYPPLCYETVAAIRKGLRGRKKLPELTEKPRVKENFDDLIVVEFSVKMSHAKPKGMSLRIKLRTSSRLPRAGSMELKAIEKNTTSNIATRTLTALESSPSVERLRLKYSPRKSRTSQQLSSLWRTECSLLLGLDLSWPNNEMIEYQIDSCKFEKSH